MVSGGAGSGPLDEVAPGTRVERLEIFFDLVFVFAFFTIARVLSADLTPGGLLRGLLVLALLWWSWCSHLAVANRVRVSEGIAPAVIVAVMIATFTLAVAIPQAFLDEPGGVSGPYLVAGCYFTIRALNLTLHWYAARDDPAQRRRLLIYAVPLLVTTALLVTAGLVPADFHGVNQLTARTGLWALAVVVAYGAGLISGVSGWAVPSAGHWVERFELIIIIALGEAVISVGIGSGIIDRPITWPVIAATAVFIALTATLWWAYFDLVAPAAQQTVYATHGERRVHLTRDAYIYLHLPMITGIILFALGGEEVLHHLGKQHLDLGQPQPGPGMALTYAGIILFLAGHLAFQLRILGTVTWIRVVTIVGLTALILPAVRVPALAALALLAAAAAAFVTAEAVLLAGSRRELRRAVLHERLAHETNETTWRHDRYG